MVKSKIRIWITYKDTISDNAKDRIEQYYFMYASDKYDYTIDYIWEKVWPSWKYSQIVKWNDKKFDFFKKNK